MSTRNLTITPLPHGAVRIDVIKLAGQLLPFTFVRELVHLGNGWSVITQSVGGDAATIAGECRDLCDSTAKEVHRLAVKGSSTDYLLAGLAYNDLAHVLAYRAACLTLGITQHQQDVVAANERIAQSQEKRA